MKKILISTLSIVLIIAAIFVSLFIIPQFVGEKYSIQAMPTKVEYVLVTKVDMDGNTYLEKDENWNMSGLEVIKANIMGQTKLVDPKDYSVTFPSLADGAGDYEIKIVITKTGEELIVPIKVVMGA